MNRQITYAALASLGAIACGVYACSDDVNETTTATTGQPGPSGTGGSSVTSGPGGGEVSVGVNVGGSGGGQGGACADVVVEASVEKLPADIIFVIDNSGSMTEELNSVEQNINVNFANIIQSSGVDYRVIMVTDHGASTLEICVGPPLSTTTNCSGAPQFSSNFYHYDINVQSWDSPCRMFGSQFGAEPDEWSLAPQGWSTWLRTQAVKVFVEITDDRLSCVYQTANMTNNADDSATGQMTATAFDQYLLSSNPSQFGTVADRNYIFYSIIGLATKMNPLDPYNEFEPVVTTTCNTAVSPGTGYQWLSKGTGALRFPMCQYQSYDVVFQDIAAGVIDVTSVPCEFDVPAPPQGQMLDLNTVDVLYTPGGGGNTQTWTQVDTQAQCGPGKFWIDETAMPPRIYLCDEACTVVEADEAAKVEVKIECGFIKG